MNQAAFDYWHIPKCDTGKHMLVSREPVDHGDCVNVKMVCEQCGKHVRTDSWTKEAWLKRKPR